MNIDPTVLTDVVRVRMPFGKYKNVALYRLPVSYLEWFQRTGFPDGRLGMLLETMCIIKTNGLDELLAPIIKDYEHGAR